MALRQILKEKTSFEPTTFASLCYLVQNLFSSPGSGLISSPNNPSDPNQPTLDDSRSSLQSATAQRRVSIDPNAELDRSISK